MKIVWNLDILINYEDSTKYYYKSGIILTITFIKIFNKSNMYFLSHNFKTIKWKWNLIILINRIKQVTNLKKLQNK
jgi:hypothetical protein